MTYLWFLALLEERLLARLLGDLVAGEVAGAGDLLNNLRVHTAHIDNSLGRDDISGVYSSERDSINLEGTGNEENALVEGLEENDTLAAEATSEEDENGAGNERLAVLGRADSLANLYLLCQ